MARGALRHSRTHLAAADTGQARSMWRTNRRPAPSDFRCSLRRIGGPADTPLEIRGAANILVAQGVAVV